MRWKQARRSKNIEDRRGGAAPLALKGAGVGVILLVVVTLLRGGDLSSILELLSTQNSAAAGASTQTAGTGSVEGHDEAIDFVSAVLGETEDVWNELFREMGQSYREPTLVVFTGAVQSACGTQSSAVGPFYCPGDSNVYIDLIFFEDLRTKLGAAGDFAQAYVLAHEVGHHVQNLLGISRQVQAQRASLSEAGGNELSVRLELQADFFAGVWAHHASRLLERGDIEEAMNAATQIGDDRLQKKARGYVTPDSFTHGTSEQRVRWFKRGFESGDPDDGDTFNARKL